MSKIHREFMNFFKEDIHKKSPRKEKFSMYIYPLLNTTIVLIFSKYFLQACSHHSYP